MGLGWQMGAEWFETCLLDYDPCSNYGNWTYGGGVGNDPREDKYFSIPKQAQNYDPDGEHVVMGWRTVIFGFVVPQDGFVHKESLYAEDEMIFVDKEGIMPMPKLTNISFENEFQAVFPTIDPKYGSKRKSKDIHTESKKEAHKPQGTWFDVKVNTHVYVTGLPEDVT
ncbi:hypothetical protein SUGI_1056640 [Cryptomeria japonica]|nr:hypothetical protein SUGI_1056640 [Cryptomeria japonica]